MTADGWQHCTAAQNWRSNKTLICHRGILKGMFCDTLTGCNMQGLLKLSSKTKKKSHLHDAKWSRKETNHELSWLAWRRNSFRGIKRTNVIQWGWATVQQIVACWVEMSNCNCSGAWWSRLSRRHGHHGAWLYGLWAQLLPSPPLKWQN